MKKIILAVAVAALAVMAVASSASADVTRCDASVPVVTTVTTATFTALQPKDTVGQFGNVWKHDYTVIVDADGTFTGTGTVSDNNGPFAWAEDVTGKFNTDKSLVSFDTVPVGGGATFKVTDAPMNNTTVIAQSTWTANVVEFRISPASVTTDTTTTPAPSP